MLYYHEFMFLGSSGCDARSLFYERKCIQAVSSLLFSGEESQKCSGEQDPETYEKLMEGNAAYLAKQMVEENRNLSTETVSENQDMLSQEQEKEEHIQPSENKKKTEIPAVTETPAITEAPSVTAAPVLATYFKPAPVINLAPEILADYDYLLNNFFIIDENTDTNPEQLNAKRFLEKILLL